MKNGSGVMQAMLPKWAGVVLTAVLTFLLLVPAGAGFAGPKGRSKPTNKPLVLVMNYPYQITGTAKTRIHAVLFTPEFVPAVGAKVTVNGKKVGVADDNGTCIFDYVPGSNKSHKLEATLKKGGSRYKVTKQFASNARTASFRSDQLFYTPTVEFITQVTIFVFGSWRGSCWGITLRYPERR
jgi:hypothetical protein